MDKKKIEQKAERQARLQFLKVLKESYEDEGRYKGAGQEGYQPMSLNKMNKKQQAAQMKQTYGLKGEPEGREGGSDYTLQKEYEPERTKDFDEILRKYIEPKHVVGNGSSEDTDLEPFMSYEGVKNMEDEEFMKQIFGNYDDYHKSIDQFGEDNYDDYIGKTLSEDDFLDILGESRPTKSHTKYDDEDEEESRKPRHHVRDEEEEEEESRKPRHHVRYDEDEEESRKPRHHVKHDEKEEEESRKPRHHVRDEDLEEDDDYMTIKKDKQLPEDEDWEEKEEEGMNYDHDLVSEKHRKNMLSEEERCYNDPVCRAKKRLLYHSKNLKEDYENGFEDVDGVYNDVRLSNDRDDQTTDEEDIYNSDKILNKLIALLKSHGVHRDSEINDDNIENSSMRKIRDQFKESKEVEDEDWEDDDDAVEYEDWGEEKSDKDVEDEDWSNDNPDDTVVYDIVGESKEEGEKDEEKYESDIINQLKKLINKLAKNQEKEEEDEEELDEDDLEEADEHENDKDEEKDEEQEEDEEKDDEKEEDNAGEKQAKDEDTTSNMPKVKSEQEDNEDVEKSEFVDKNKGRDADGQDDYNVEDEDVDDMATKVVDKLEKNGYYVMKPDEDFKNLQKDITTEISKKYNVLSDKELESFAKEIKNAVIAKESLDQRRFLNRLRYELGGEDEPSEIGMVDRKGNVKINPEDHENKKENINVTMKNATPENRRKKVEESQSLKDYTDLIENGDNNTLDNFNISVTDDDSIDYSELNEQNDKIRRQITESVAAPVPGVDKAFSMLLETDTDEAKTNPEAGKILEQIEFLGNKTRNVQLNESSSASSFLSNDPTIKQLLSKD